MEASARELARRQAEICSLFGNPIRVMILWVLAQREMTVSDIATAVRASLQNTSQHLRLMKDKRVLTARREGSSVYYRIRPNQDLEGCRLLDLAPQIRLDEPTEASDLTPR